MLVPLTASLYVPGKLDDADKVLVDVGTGYFIEVSWWIFVLVAVDSVLIFCEVLNCLFWVLFPFRENEGNEGNFLNFMFFYFWDCMTGRFVSL